MATNQTATHKKLTRIQEKLATLDKRSAEQGETLRDVRQQTRLMAQMLGVVIDMQRESHETLRDISQMARDTALLVSENLKETRALRNGDKGRHH